MLPKCINNYLFPFFCLVYITVKKRRKTVWTKKEFIPGSLTSPLHPFVDVFINKHFINLKF